MLCCERGGKSFKLVNFNVRRRETSRQMEAVTSTRKAIRRAGPQLLSRSLRQHRRGLSRHRARKLPLPPPNPFPLRPVLLRRITRRRGISSTTLSSPSTWWVPIDLMNVSCTNPGPVLHAVYYSGAEKYAPIYFLEFRKWKMKKML